MDSISEVFTLFGCHWSKTFFNVIYSRNLGLWHKHEIYWCIYIHSWNANKTKPAPHIKNIYSMYGSRVVQYPLTQVSAEGAEIDSSWANMQGMQRNWLCVGFYERLHTSYYTLFSWWIILLIVLIMIILELVLVIFHVMNCFRLEYIYIYNSIARLDLKRAHTCTYTNSLCKWHANMCRIWKCI